MIRIQKRLIQLIICLAITTSFPFLVAQESEEESVLQISGVVTAYDGTPLTGVEISILGTERSVTTNDSGEYVINDPPKGTFTLAAHLEGFEDNEIEVEFFDVSRTINFSLPLEDIEYEITVRTDMPRLMEASSAIGVVEIKPEELTSLPTLGERDIFRAAQFMPGISASNEASSGLYVRGGTPGQNLVLLDGMNIYEVDHFYGIFSAFNPSAISNITMHKGAFGAEYGERLSSVVDMTGRSGISDTTVIGGGASFLSANGYIDVPIGDKGSFMFAGRRSYTTFLSNHIHDAYDSSTKLGFNRGSRGADFESDPVATFWDVNARANFQLTNNDTLILSGYFGRDNLDNSRINELSSIELAFSGQYQTAEDLPDSLTMDIGDLSNWGNDAGSVTWIRNWTGNFTSIASGSVSSFFRDYERTNTTTEVDSDGNELEPESRGNIEHNRVDDYTFRLTNYYTPVQGHNLVFGGQVTSNEIDYDYKMTEFDVGIDNSWSGNLYSAFAKDIFSPVKWLTFTPGIRATYYEVTEKTYVDPRLALTLHLNDRVSLKAAGGEYHQFTSRLLRENPLQGDKWFWMIADDELIPVSKSRNLLAGFSWENPEYLFNVEFYDRQLEGLSEFASARIRPRWDNTIGDLDLYDQFFIGEGSIRGIELLLQKKFGQNTGWVTYSNGEVEYTFPDFQNSSYPASHDSTHEFKIVDSYKWRNFTFSGTWVYATGKPFTPPTGDIIEVEVEGPDGEERTFEQVELGEKNSMRLPDYHRLDLSAQWEFLNRDGNRGNVGVSVFNAYDNNNVWRYEYQALNDEIYTTQINYLGFTISAFANFDIGLPKEENQVGPISGETGFQSYSQAQEAQTKDPTWDFHGTVKSMDLRSITIDTKWGQKTLEIDAATIKGEPTFEAGAPVHVYYKKGKEDQLIVTMIFRVLD